MRLFLRNYYGWFAALLVAALLTAVPIETASAASAFPPEQSPGSVGLQGTISEAAPVSGATISTPVSGASVTSVPVTVSGLCPKGLLVKVFSNNIFVGSEVCSSGSYSIQVDLFGGENELVARVYDALDQAGPDSNTVVMMFNDSQHIKLGTVVSLTSDYAERGADPGSILDWPITLSGGTGPYAVTVDWGDNTPSDLMSEQFTGDITLQHTYKAAGVYNVIIKAADSNNTEAFLQVVAISNGAIQANASSKSASTAVQTKVFWWPAALMVPLILAAFWIGRRFELLSLRRKLEQGRQGK